MKKRADATNRRGQSAASASDQDKPFAQKVIGFLVRVITGQPTDKEGREKNPHATRETVESIVVAVILAFLFRGFVAEAFVIPTGSMATTLRGRHMDIRCPECRHQYIAGASMENVEDGYRRGEVTETTCPICGYTLELDKKKYPNERSFNGDRILVSKFAYELTDPERWDVIVFKYPGNAKQNYIKRLIGLPGESIRIQYGDIHISNDQGANWEIARKPPAKLRAMLQLVDDTDHIGQSLKAIGWPARWQQTSEVAVGQRWQVAEAGNRYTVQAGDRDSWMRYHHIIPRRGEWRDIDSGVLPRRAVEATGELITDHYAYNDSQGGWDTSGTVWVGDLAVECEVEVESDAGELLLELIEGGTHYECRLDIATGRATLGIRDFENNQLAFTSSANPVAETAVSGRGTYHLRFANCDDRLTLWVNERVVEFKDGATYKPPQPVTPRWSPDDPGDMAPAGLGGRNAQITANRLRVLRDIYYLAHQPVRDGDSEYDVSDRQFPNLVSNPELWATTDLFHRRRAIEYHLGADQFFPLGDNSPQSKDARLWSSSYSPYEGFQDPPPYFERDLLIGKALLVYWPHGWRPSSSFLAGLTGNFAFIPNFGQMKLIR